MGLDSPNHVDRAQEIRFYAEAAKVTPAANGAAEMAQQLRNRGYTPFEFVTDNFAAARGFMS